MKIIKEKIIKPPRLLIYGVGGIGKTTLLSQLPNPIFIDIEGGADEIGVDRFEQAEFYSVVKEQLKQLISEEHQYKTLVIDSADWLEKLMEVDAAKHFNADSVGEVGYGQGYSHVLANLSKLLDGLNWLRENKKMIIAFTGHAKIATFEDPTSQNYSRYTLDCREKFAAMIIEWCDLVGFANYRFAVKKEGENFGKEIVKAKGSGERVLYVNERPAYIAKNRYGISESLPMNANKILKAIAGNGASDSDTNNKDK